MQLPVAHDYPLEPSGDLVEDGRLRVQGVAGLVDPGQLHRGADLQFSRIGLVLAHDHAEQRRLTGAVRSYHSDDASGREQERQVVDQEAIPETLPELLGIDHLVAEPGPGWDGDLELVGALLGRLGLGDEVVVGGDARFALGLAGLRRHPDPLELTGERLASRPVGLLLGCEPGLLLLEPGGVVALPRDPCSPIELEDPPGHVVEEIAVVGYGDDSALILLQGAFQPRHRLGVEVVRGLVQQQQVGLGQEQPAEGDAPPLAAGELGHVHVGRWQPEGVHGDLEGPFEIPCPGRVDLVLQVCLLFEEGIEVGVRIGEPGTDLVETVDEGFALGDAVRDVAEHVLFRIELRLLGEEPDGEAGREAGLAGKAVVDPGHDPQQ